MRSTNIWMPALACALIGCGPSAPSSPEAAVRALLEAARASDGAAFRAAFPSREEAAELLECPPDGDAAARWDGLSAELVAWRDARPELAALSEVARAPVAAGEAVGPCVARRPMTLVKADVRLVERGVEATYTMRFADVDGRVRVLGF